MLRLSLNFMLRLSPSFTIIRYWLRFSGTSALIDVDDDCVYFTSMPCDTLMPEKPLMLLNVRSTVLSPGVMVMAVAAILHPAQVISTAVATRKVLNFFMIMNITVFLSLFVS